jgi:hypothetical protein
MIPLPKDDVTPPVTKIYFVLLDMPVMENRITGYKDKAGEAYAPNKLHVLGQLFYPLEFNQPFASGDA